MSDAGDVSGVGPGAGDAGDVYFITSITGADAGDARGAGKARASCFVTVISWAKLVSRTIVC